MKEQSLSTVTQFLKNLEEARMHYSLDSCRDNSIMVEVSLPGEKWEIEFFSSGEIEIEKFRSLGDMFDESELKVLFNKFADYVTEYTDQNAKKLRKI